MDYPDDPKYRQDQKTALEYIDPDAGPSTFTNIVGTPLHGDEAFKGLSAFAAEADELFIVTWMCDPEMEIIRDNWDQPVSARLDRRLAQTLITAAKRGATISIILWDPTALTSSDSTIEDDPSKGVPQQDDFVEVLGPGDWMQRKKKQIQEWYRITQAVNKLRTDLRAISQKNELIKVSHPTELLGSHHQKFWIRRKGKNLAALVGGINLNQLAWDDANHEPINPRRNPQSMEGKDRKARFDNNDPPEDLPRHDWMIRVEGHAAHALLEEFYSRWAQQTLAPPKKVLPAPTDVESNGKMFVQVSRCWPKDPAPQQILKAYVKAFKRATKYIYVEDQYWTSNLLTDLVDKQLDSGQLERFIVVLPFKPEEEGLVSKWIVAEQNYQLGRLLAKHGSEAVQVYQMFRKNPARNEYYNVYVHAKLAICDDLWLTVGSANTNQRSLELCDSETNIQLAHDTVVPKIRKQLWAELAGDDATQDDPMQAILQGLYKTGVQNQDAKRQGKELKGLIIKTIIDGGDTPRPPEWARKYL